MNRFVSISLFVLLAATVPAAAQPITVTFEGLSPPVYTPPGSTMVDGALFNNTQYVEEWGSYWSGWSFSNFTDVTTPGFENDLSAYSLPGGGGFNSANYAVGTAFNNGDSTITLPEGYRPDSVMITNTTYAALAIRDGYFVATAFEPGDWFKLTITGYNDANETTGFVDFYLANYTSPESLPVSEWTNVDLSSLAADTTKLSFGLSSTDNDPVWGMNTPAYFALDNLVLNPVPEPATVGLLGLAGVGAWRVLRRRRTGGERTAIKAV